MVIGMLALGARGCASAPMVDLVPHAPGVHPPANRRDVRLESSASTIVVEYAGPWRNWFVFDVTVVNRSDSVMRVVPEQFSMSLARSQGKKTWALGSPIHAASAEQTVASLDRGLSREGFLWGALLGLEGVAMVANLASMVVNSAEETPEDQDTHLQMADDLLSIGQATADAAGARLGNLDDERERWFGSALGSTALAPGSSVSGTLAVPGSSLHRWLGYDPSPYEREWTIIGEPRRPAGQYRLTLRAPSRLGGQQFEFDVGDW